MIAGIRLFEAVGGARRKAAGPRWPCRLLLIVQSIIVPVAPLMFSFGLEVGAPLGMRSGGRTLSGPPAVDARSDCCLKARV
jgi:hypothetical protein